MIEIGENTCCLSKILLFGKDLQQSQTSVEFGHAQSHILFHPLPDNKF